jgi:hypothetical protein
MLFGALLTAGAVHAHGTGSHTGFQSTVSYIEPQQPGLLVQVLEGHVRLSAANLTKKNVVILDAQGNPLVRVPAGKTRVWREPRIGASEPPPEREGLVRNWRISGTADGEPFRIVGFLGYRPPHPASSDGDGLPTWAIVLAGVAVALVLAAALAVPYARSQNEA